MTEEFDEVKDDDAEYWGPIVERRFEDLQNIQAFMRDNRDRISIGVRSMARNLAMRQMSMQDNSEHSCNVFGPYRQTPPATAAWAAILRQARHVMVETIKEHCPELADDIPRESEFGGGYSGPSGWSR
jgi:hypothetical protein